jgi:GxxExxY protein
LAGWKVRTQVPVPITIDGLELPEGFRADLIVNEKVIVELKSTEESKKLFAKQLLTYLRLSKLKLGLLINFGASHLKDGIERVVNGL